MPSAINKETGEILVLSSEGDWTPAKLAQNPETGERLFLDGDEWKPVPAPKRSAIESATRGLGMGARSVVEGVTALPGMLYDAAALPINLASKGVNALGGNLPMIAPANQIVSNRLTDIGLPQPETAGERVQMDMQRNVAAALPTMGAGVLMSGIRGATGSIAQTLAANPASQVAGAAGAGAASGMARERGAGPIGQTAAGLVGGIGGATAAQSIATGTRALAAAAQPFTQTGRERIAADTLLRQSSDPATLRARIETGLLDTGRRLPGSPVTTATAARDPGLMVMERGLASDVGRSTGQGGMSGSAALRDIEAQRNATRLAAMQGMADDLTSETRGAGVRQVLAGSERSTRQAVSQLYRGVDPDNTTAVPVYQIGRGMFDAAERRYGPGGGAMPTEAANILDEIRTAADAGRTVDFRWMQNVRSRLGSAAGQAATQGDDRAASTFREMRTALENAIADSVESGRGFTADQAATWRAATNARREMGATFGRDETGASAVGQILKTDSFGRPIMADASIAERAIANPANVRQVLRAAGLRSNEVRQNLRGEFVDRMMQTTRTSGVVADAQGNVTPALSAAGFDKFFTKNRAVADLIFDGPQRDNLRRLANDFSESAMTNTMGKARGSDTAQNLSVANFIARASNGLVSPNDPGAQTVASLGGVMRLIYAAPEAATREMIVQAAVDPRFASILLNRATPANVQRAAEYLNTTMIDRLSSAAMGATARGATRTANEIAAQQ